MSIFSKKLGIDLGTANTSFLCQVAECFNEPSVVAVSEEDNRIMVSYWGQGDDRRTPENIVAYRPMKDGLSLTIG